MHRDAHRAAGHAAKRGNGQRAEVGNAVWNAVGGMLNAGQSVFLLIVITRVCGLNAAGIFSIAFATGNLFLYLGNYGVRNYQVSDLAERFSFADYLRHRLLTVGLMLIAAAVYVAWSAWRGEYSTYKTACVCAMCLLKAVDCLEEVFEGRYQQKGRLDQAGKLVVARLVISIGGMMAVLLWTGDLLGASLAAVLLAAAASAVMIYLFRRTAEYVRTPFSVRSILELMRECLPVCAVNFLSFYLINEPKYAIDAAMDETAQACYNFIAMPVFVIQLLNMFLYQPMLISMTKDWKSGNRAGFVGSLGRVAGALLLTSVPIFLAAGLWGIPVLSWLYHTDLSEYRTELLLVLTGGVFLAFNGFCAAVLTIIRAQRHLPLAYLAGTILSVLLTPRLVAAYGILGAVVAFVCVMGAVSVVLAVLLAGKLRLPPRRVEKTGRVG